MLRSAVVLTTLSLAIVSPAVAADKPDVGQIVGDALSGVLGKNEKAVRGNVVSIGPPLIMRGDDGRTYTVDTASLPAASWQTLQPGDTVTIAAKPGRNSGELIASRIQADRSPSASGPSASGYQRIRGYVESVGVSSLTLKEDSGRTVAVDTSGLNQQMVASTRPGDLVSVVGQMTGTGFRASVIQKQ